ncbi:FG-GAP and VCBS repeat-containing protein [Streptomyces sp. Qhu-G9]|uniref:FG-GAP and VCBS repeat-containing protein n=1 Tax=Streptomyces sp. Qhu-G9 TaxID=3452799 RepID=UPI0022AC5E62|nr:FG-GAP and VCBS repeat-containing protein [Streptomyces aurantiacus]WAU78769.1 FG-GAP and VCBS repeat-containing protein [Streptomyces aurantiacus]
MQIRTYVLATTVAATAAATALALAPTAAAAPLSPSTSDFNGDGYPDLAVGVPDGAVGGKARAGYVSIVWGGPKGVGTRGGIRISQSTAELPGTPETGDRFGASVVLEDLNGDGIAELLVGVPGEDVTGRGTDAGLVSVVGGAKGGPGPGSNVVTGPAASAAYGLSVAAADLTGDGSRDIVTGGRDKVVLRTADGLSSTVVTAPMGGRAPILTTGDFTGDGAADLAVGYWTTDPFTQSHVRIWAWEKTENALANVWNTDNAGVSALASGDFDGDGHDDLVLGECREIADENIDDPCGPEALAKGGGLHIHYGAGPNGSFGFRKQTLNQDTVGVPGVAESGDRFGAALAVADIDGDGRDDVIAGAPGEAIGTRAGAGAATLLLGTKDGLVDAFGEGHGVGYQQDTPRVPGVAEAGDAFGAAVATGDYDHDGAPDTAIGSPGENARSGGVWVLPHASVNDSYTVTPAKLGLPSPSSALTYGKTLSSR